MEANRRFLVCYRCQKVTKFLAVHLKRACMKTDTNEARKDTLSEAKERADNMLRDHVVIPFYGLLKEFPDDMDRDIFKTIVEAFERRGHLITDQPPSDWWLRGRASNKRQRRSNSGSSATKRRRVEETESTSSTEQSDEIHLNFKPRSLRTVLPVPSCSTQSADTCVTRESESEYEPPDRETSSDSAEVPNSPSQTTAMGIAEASDSSKDGFEFGTTKYSESTRSAMQAAGLYKCHAIDEGHLKGFRDHQKDNQKLRINHYRQTCQNVGRLLFYLNNNKEDISRLADTEEVHSFITKLQKILSAQTVKNYVKALKRFIVYLQTSTNIYSKDRTLYKSLEHLDTCIGAWNKQGSRLVAIEMVKQRVKTQVSKDQPSINDCQAVLNVAENDFLAALESARSGCATNMECCTVISYLTALLCLRHFQRKGVVENFLVEEWLNKLSVPTVSSTEYTFYIKEHKTGTTQPATFCLDQYEYECFETYFAYCRPLLLDKAKSSDSKYFFLSSTGKKIFNASNDLNRFQSKKYKLRPINATQARKAMQTATRGALSGADLTLVEDYLAHSANVAERFYRLKTPTNVCKAKQLMDRLRMTPVTAQDDSQDASDVPAPQMASTSTSDSQCAVPMEVKDVPKATDADSGRSSPTDSVTSIGEVKGINFKILKQRHPVTLYGKGPSLIVCKNVNLENPKKLVNQWNYAQNRLRAQHICELRQFHKHQPRREDVAKLLASNGWSVSISAIVLKSWKPKEGRNEKTSVCRSATDICLTQEWPGLCIVQNETRGRVVCTTKPFSKGDVVTDYHGEVVTYDEGLKRQGEVEEAGYIMFLRQQGIAIDATKEACACHPGKVLYGRFISHSKKGKRTNVLPKKITIEEGLHVVFVALNKINSGAELFFDYGVRQNDFNEGADLKWL